MSSQRSIVNFDRDGLVLTSVNWPIVNLDQSGRGSMSSQRAVVNFDQDGPVLTRVNEPIVNLDQS